MLKPTLFLFIGLGVGMATVTLWREGPGDAAVPAAPSAALVERVEALESALNRETLRRVELEGELAVLRERVDAAATSAGGHGTSGSVGEDEAEGAEAAPELRARRRLADADDDLTVRLVAAGFSADRAEYLTARAESLRMEALQARYEARREGRPLDFRAFGMDALREELGDQEYERYLTAIGRPTSVNVGGVLASSPAEQAGILPGDEIVAYAGTRVFDQRDLNALMLEGKSGEPVTVDVLRDGQPIQLVLPRGPLGISGRGFRRR